ncbi:GLUG motif-containing protein [Tepidibacter mesophilus]|uniref:GLUG motif-containing protein n=1 Tax=Tepidibacter mesophilus TaxID=655607 RepID=UPI000C0741AD|nr:GLUG motif-containing protein [Tepidibacter mesophilus]
MNIRKLNKMIVSLMLVISLIFTYTCPSVYALNTIDTKLDVIEGSEYKSIDEKENSKTYTKDIDTSDNESKDDIDSKINEVSDIDEESEDKSANEKEDSRINTKDIDNGDTELKEGTNLKINEVSDIDEESEDIKDSKDKPEDSINEDIEEVPLLKIPQNIQTEATEDEIRIMWDEVGNATGYDIEVDGQIIDNGANISYIHSKLEENTTHTYRIRAKNETTVSDFSSQIYVKVLSGIQGIGTLENPFIIKTREQLEGIKNNLSAHYRLENNIDLQNIEWSPIGTSTVPFTGSLDGNGYKISNLKISKSTINNIGLFGYVKDSSIKNLKINNVNIQGQNNVGGLIGYSTGNYNVQNCSVIGTGSIYGTEFIGGLIGFVRNYDNVKGDIISCNSTIDVGGYGYIGGLVGEVVLSNVKKSYATGNVVAESARSGGLIGAAYGVFSTYTYINISECYATGDVSAGGNIGGLIGVANAARIKNCFALGNVSSSSGGIGGLVGFAYYASVQSSYCSGKIVRGKDIDVGGIIGAIRERVSINNSYYDIEVCEWSSKVPTNIGKLNLDMKKQITFTDWDFNNIWSIDDCKSYPYLKNLHMPIHREMPKCKAPPGLVVLNVSENSIKLAWNKVDRAVGYDIEIDGDIVDNGINTTFTHRGLEEKVEHIYRVRAKDEIGVGAWSNILVQKICLVGEIKNIKTESTKTTVKVTWDSIPTATDYDVEVDGVIVDNKSNTTYTEIGLQEGTNHSYRVRPKVGTGVGKWSDIVTQKTCLLDTPENIKTEETKSSVSIIWDSVEKATGYDIEIDGNVVDNGINTTFIHNKLASGTNHSYRIRAKNESDISEWSNLYTQKTCSLDMPANINAEAKKSSISIMWNSVENATGYDMEIDGKVVDNGINTTFIHNKLASGTNHSYRIRAKNENDISEWSNIVTQRTCLLNRPEHIMTEETKSSISIIWDPVENATGYDIEVDGDIVDNGANTTFIHNKLMPGTEHSYRIRAKNKSDMSEWININTQKTCLLDEVTNIQAASTGNVIQIIWDSVENATGYDVEVDGTIKDNNMDIIYVHNNLEPSTEHIYRVRAKNGEALGEWSERISILTTKLTDEVSGEWQTLKPMPTSRSGAGVIKVNDKIYVIGGRIGNKKLKSVEEYNPETDTWTVKADMLTAKAQFGIAEVNGKIYVIGGIGNEYKNTVEEYNPNTDTWIVKADMPTARAQLGVVQVNGKIYAIGGYNGRSLNKVELYNPKSDSWEEKEDMPTARRGLGVIETNAKIYAISGDNLNTIEEYDPNSDKWTQKLSLLTERNFVQTVNLEGKIFVIGGYKDGTNINTVEVYNPQRNIFTKQSSMAVARSQFGTVELNKKIYAIGGIDNNGKCLNKVEVFEFLLSQDELSIPTNIKTNVKDTEITLTWDEVENSTGYDIEVDGNIIDNGKNTTYTHSELTVDTNHTYRVRGKNNDKKGMWSNQLNEKTILIPSPKNIILKASKDSISMRWNEVEYASRYDIEIDGKIIDDIDVTSYTHSGLNIGEEHTYRIRAKNEKSIGMWSEPIVKATVETTLELDVPNSISASASENSAIITWNAIEDATGYDIEVDGTVIDNGNGTTYAHNGLEKGTQHIYKVRAKNERRTSRWSDVITVATLLGTKGTGTVDNPFIIKTKEQLKKMRNNPNEHYKLGADIDLENEEWEPIGSLKLPYKGSFDGNGYTISNLKINKPSSDCVGFFGYAEECVVKNVKINNIDVKGKVSVGGLIGRIQHDKPIDTIIENCKVEGKGKVNGSQNVGGLIGWIATKNIHVIDCASKVDIEGTRHYVGGLIGNTNGRVEKSYATGNVVSRGDAVGGLIGTSAYNNTTECYATGDVFGNLYVGGLVGASSWGKIENCFSLGDVTGNNAGGIVGVKSSTLKNSYSIGKVNGNITGGLVGKEDRELDIKNSYYDSEVSEYPPKKPTDVARITSQMKSKETFIDWDFEGVWNIDEGNSYPYLRTLPIPEKIKGNSEINEGMDGNGKIDNPFIIKTKEQLKKMRNNPNEHYKLGADIDLENEEWEPIGSLKLPYKGSFDGNGYTISNLKINKPSSDCVGFFGYAEECVVKNVKINNIDVKGKVSVGGLIGRIQHDKPIDTIIENCKVEGKGKVNGSQNVGGLIGWIATKNIHVIDCASKVDIEGTRHYVGGLIGNTNGRVEKSYATGNVVSRGDAVGGLIGTSAYNNTTECYATGDVFGNLYVGGLVGASSWGKIENCFSLGDVTGNNAGGIVGVKSSTLKNSYSIGKVNGNITGGLVGKEDRELDIKNSYYDSEVSEYPPKKATDVARITSQMKSKTTFAGWDFENIWDIEEGNSYPYLRNLPVPNHENFPERLPPTQLVITEKTLTSISLSWNTVEGATSYDIEIDGQVIDNGLNTTYVHDGLIQGEPHTYRVRAKNSEKVSSWTPKLVVGPLLNTPKNLNAVEQSGAINITWDTVEKAIGYDIEVDGVLIDNGVKNTYIHNNVASNKQHTYRVRAKNDLTKSNWSDITSIIKWDNKGICLASNSWINNLENGDEMEVEVKANALDDVYTIQMELVYNPELFDVNEESIKNLMWIDDQNAYIKTLEDDKKGSLKAIVSQTKDNLGKSGEFDILSMKFKLKTEQNESIKFNLIKLVNSKGEYIEIPPVSELNIGVLPDVK